VNDLASDNGLWTVCDENGLNNSGKGLELLLANRPRARLFQLAIGLFETTSQKDLLPSDACGVSLATSSCPGAMLPSFGGQRTHFIHKVVCASGKPFIG
jgi:hypothetical protein